MIWLLRWCQLAIPSSKCYHHHEKIDQNHRKMKLKIGYSRFVFIQVNASVNTNLCWRFFKNDEISIFETILVWYFTRESWIWLVLGLVVCPDFANSSYFFKNSSGKFQIFVLKSTFLHDETIFFIPVCFYVYIYAYRVLEMIFINFCP